MGDELQKSIQEALASRIFKDSFLRQFRETLEHDDAAGLKLEDAHEYAIKRGEASSGALLDVLRPGILPNDRMDMDTARQTVLPVLEGNFDDVQDAANQVQRALDRAAGIGLNGVRADFPKNRAAGLLDKLTESESVEKMQSLLGEPVVNFSAAAFDQWVHANADFRYEAGMSPKVIRKGHPGMCVWCAPLVGTYDYEAVRHGSNVWRRHRNCRCVVLFTSERGKFRDVHSKIEYSKIRDARVARLQQIELERQEKEEAKRIMRERIKDGEYNLKLQWQKYAEHVEGTPQYQNTVKTRKKDELSRLSISFEKAQELITLYSGSGEPRYNKVNGVLKVSNVEFCTANQVIGQYFDAGKQEYVDTRRFALYHGKKGSHIVPVKPR